MRWRNGFTVTEALLAVSLLAMAVTAITVPFTAVAHNEAEDARRCLAGLLATEMMEDVLAKPFDDPDGPSSPGPEAGETARSDFDNVDDYDGYSESSGAVASMSGAVMDDPGATGLSRHVDVDYVYVSGQDTDGAATFARVTVRVDYEGDEVLTVARLCYAYP